MRRKTSHRGFAFSAPAVVFPARYAVANHRVANHETRLVTEWKKPVFERAAVEQQGVAILPMAGNKLVHDSAARTHKLVLGFLAQQGQFREIDRLTRHI